MKDRLADVLLSALALVLSEVAETWQAARVHWICCVRDKHWMTEQTDGPACARCGTTWPWRT